MGISSIELKHHVIKPVLAKLGEHAPTATLLLQATCHFESEQGRWLKSGKQLGIYGMDKRLHREIWDTWLVHDPELASRVRGMASQHSFLVAPHRELITNLAYATAMAWCGYRMRHVLLPEATSAGALSQCWHRYYRLDATACELAHFAGLCSALLEEWQGDTFPTEAHQARERHTAQAA